MQLIDYPLLMQGNGEQLRQLRDIVVSMAREDVQKDLADLNEEAPNLDDQTKKARRESIHQKLKKLKPGGTACLAALKTVEGNTVSSGEEIAEELAKHWSKVFRAKEIDFEGLDAWIREAAPSWNIKHLPSEERKWQVKKEHIKRAIK